MIQLTHCFSALPNTFFQLSRAVNGAKSFHFLNVLSNVRTKHHGSQLPPCIFSSKSVACKSVNKWC